MLNFYKFYGTFNGQPVYQFNNFQLILHRAILIIKHWGA